MVEASGFAREALDPKVVSRFGLTFAHDGQTFISTDPDGFVGVWDTKSAQRTETLSDFEGVAHLWRAPSWEEIEAAERKQEAP